MVIADQVVPQTSVRRPRVAALRRGPGVDMEVDSTPIGHRDPVDDRTSKDNCPDLVTRCPRKEHAVDFQNRTGRHDPARFLRLKISTFPGRLNLEGFDSFTGKEEGSTGR